MSDPILNLYQKELAFVRRLGAEFAKAYPKIAGNLRIGPETIEDPHVSRLVESFAFLNARIRLKLEDDFPELTDALLSVLYPHYLAPVPSMAVVQFEIKPDITAAYDVAPGTQLETDPVEGEPVRFRTTYPVRAWPVRIKDVKLAGRPVGGPAATRVPGAVSSLRISLASNSDAATFDKVRPGSLRFFVRGQPQHSFLLYEMVLRNTLSVCIASAPDDREPILLPADAVRPVGFGVQEGMLPYSARSAPGYRLLTEFFAFPEKFLFFDLAGIEEAVASKKGTKLEIYLYLDRASQDLEHNVVAESLALGCTPVVNLFRQRAEPVRLSHAESEYRIVPDARRPMAMEVYSVDRVSHTAENGATKEFAPFYSVRHATAGEGTDCFWLAARRPAPRGKDSLDEGTEVYISAVDLSFRPSLPARGILDLQTTCLNRDLPGRLPFGGGQPRLRLSEGGAAVQAVRCLTAPTRTLRPPLRHGALWRFVSHLALGHMSITGGPDGADALREILRLYDFAGSQESRKMVEGLVGVSSREVAGRTVSQGIVGIVRGTEIELELDESKFVGSGAYLFAAVLERFLALHASINSFTRLSVKVRGREGETWRWGPRSGERPLL